VHVLTFSYDLRALEGEEDRSLGFMISSSILFSHV
jgi:hypothetical protein